VIAGLNERFQARFVETARGRIRSAPDGVASSSPDGIASAAGQLHSLAGEAGVLGYAGIVEVARRCEKSLRDLHGSPAAATGCARLLRDLLRAVEALAAGPTAATQGRAASDRKDAIVKRGRILIIDDSPINTEALSDVLEDAGFETRCTHDGEAALVEVGRFEPDIVLADVQMPGLPLEALCQRLRQAAGARAIRILLVSGVGESELADLAAAAGADGFVPKDHGLEAVVTRVAEATLELMR
jgi:CheY-like chemotaxis protein/HPt (histidine-containing phosphotransfer) domain-containing protein